MRLSELSLRDFRSWPQLNLHLDEGVTLFVGRNGYGKTNIIEAVGYLAHLSSHRVNSDAALVRAGAENARVSATAINEGRQLTAHLLLKPRGANQAQINRTRLRSPREVLGVVRTVLFAPEDLALVRGEPAERRRYLDAIIATRTPRLAGVKADYDKVLRQRNALLKSAGRALRRGYGSEDGAAALVTLDTWDAQLAALGAQVMRARMDLSAELDPHVTAAYAQMAPGPRAAHVTYAPRTEVEPDADVATIEAELLAHLGRARDKEIDRGMSLVGPHRDDLSVTLGDGPAKGFASHGETWSVAIALRLGEFQLLRAEGTDPILILDDVFAELDAQRRRQLVALAQEVEQVLITAAVDEDLPGNLDGLTVARHEITLDDDHLSLLDAAPHPDAEDGTVSGGAPAADAAGGGAAEDAGAEEEGAQEKGAGGAAAGEVAGEEAGEETGEEETEEETAKEEEGGASE